MTFETGQTVYGRDGQKYEFGESLSGERAVVSPIHYWNGWDGEDYEQPSYQACILPLSGLFVKPPIAAVHADVAAATAELEKVRQQIAVEHSELRNAQKAEAERLATIQRHEKLSLLSRFIAGEITHLVKVDHQIAIEPLADQACSYDKKKLKLLTLYGDSKGDLNWQLSSYSDGSGSGSWTVIPCVSYEHAKAEAQRAVDEKVEEWRLYGKPYWLSYTIDAADKYDLTIPDDVRAAYHGHRIEEAAKAVAKAQAEAQKAEAALAALASVDRSGEADETSTKIEGSAEGESAVTAEGGQTPNA